jgi:hypothetical protein
MTTRRTAGAGEAGAGVSAAAASSMLALSETGSATGAASISGTTGGAGRAMGAATVGAVPGIRSPGFAGWVITGVVGAGATTTIGGFAITGPTGGLVAIAGVGAGATICAPWRGRGTMRRGAGATATAAGGAATEALGLPAVVPAGLAGIADSVRAGGGATTAAERTGGALRAAASACLRSRMALSASPGFETCDRLNAGRASTRCFAELLLRKPPLK